MDAFATKAFLLVLFDPIADPTLHQGISCSAHYILIFLPLFLDLLVQIVVGVVETTPDLFYHFFIPLSIFHVDTVSVLNVLYLLSLMFFF